MIELAFTTRIPLAVMIVTGLKQWENRAAMPFPAKGLCAMTCSKSSDAREYANFLAWAKSVFQPEVFALLPAWAQVASWRGKLVAVFRVGPVLHGRHRFFPYIYCGIVIPSFPGKWFFC